MSPPGYVWAVKSTPAAIAGLFAPRACRALATRPRAEDISDLALAAALFATLAAIVGAWTGLLNWSPLPAGLWIDVRPIEGGGFGQVVGTF